MDLATQINLNNNPQEHTRLCVALYEAEYGVGYQAIDDNRSDDGNDGYIKPQKALVARHCFKVRPKIGLDKEILKKLKGDFQKSVKLKAGGIYDVESWIFQTNYPVSNKVVQQAIALGKTEGINVTIKTETYLADLLSKHKRLLPQFPQYQMPDILPGIDEIKARLDDITRGAHAESLPPDKNLAPANKVPNAQRPVEKPIKEDADYQKVADIINQGLSEKAKISIRAIAYMTTSPLAKMQATFALADWFDPITDAPEKIIELCDSSIPIAKRLSRPREEAALYATKVEYLTQQYTKIYLDRFGNMLYMRQFGELGGFSAEAVEKFNKGLNELDIQRIEATKAALDLVNKLGDYETAGQVMVRLGSSLAGIASTQHRCGDIEAGLRNFSAGKEMILEAIRCFGEIDDELKVVYSRHQLANQIRNYDDEKEVALEIERDVLEWAKENGDKRLEGLATQMIHTIETGEIPDYAGKIREAAKGRELA